MSSEINTPRRNKAHTKDDSYIAGRIIGQKPTCIVKIFPWDNPAKLDLMVVNFATDGSLLSNVKQTNATANARDPSTIDNDIVRCSINKSKNASSGGFSLILKRGNSNDKGQKVSDTKIDYLKVISPGDWITIYMKSDGNINPDGSDSDSGLKLLGIVENVRYVEIDDPNLGRPRLEYVVTGRDFGKIFESDIYFNPVIAGDPKLQSLLGPKFLTDSMAQFGGDAKKSPDEMIKHMLKFYVGGGLSQTSRVSQQWYVPNQIGTLFAKSKGGSSVPFYDLLNKEFIGLQRYNSDGTAQAPSPLIGEIINISAPSSGTVWQALKNYGNMSINEFVVDLKKTKLISNVNGKKNYQLEPTIQHRQVPFSNKDGVETNPYIRDRNASVGGGGADGKEQLSAQVSRSEKTFFVDLPRHVINSTDIKQKNIGKSDFERVNVISVTPSFFNFEPFNQAYRLAINIPSVQRYGTKLLEVSTAYGAKSSEFLKHATKCISLLCDWFMSAHLLYNGTIVATGTDEFVEVGQNLFIEDVRQLFHVEGVSYIYEINQESGATVYNTEFEVSRGQLVDKKGNSKFIDNATSRNDDDLYATIVTNALENIRNTTNGKPK